MGIEEYTSKGSTGTQKSTHIALPNPKHPDSEVDYVDEKLAAEYFRAALSLKNSEINRKQLIGDFLVAVNREHVQEEEGALEEFLEKLSQ